MANNTKQKIVDTAMQLFWENSFVKSVGTDLICKTAGIRKGSLYHFFPSKDALALEVVNMRWNLFENQVLKLAFDQAIPPLKRFERFADILGNMACRIKEKSGEMYGCPFGNFASELSTQKTELRNKVAKIFDEYAKYFEESLQDAVVRGLLPTNFDVKNTASLLFAGIQGSVLVAKAQNNPEELKQRLNQLFKILLR